MSAAAAAVRDGEPAYRRLAASGLLDERIEAIAAQYDQCRLCPHQCGVDRNARETGLCGATARVRVYSHTPHFGEEVPVVGRRGSGTIFFSHCNLRCVFCQNWPIAHAGRGRLISDRELADMMIDLQRRGCHNINLVTPTHVLPNIVRAVGLAMRRGLRVPLVYNTSGYERVEMIRLLDGIVDIYLPDLKFMDGAQSQRLAMEGAGDYPALAQAAILEMHRQVGTLVTDDRGIALRGLMLRHLVMPNRVAGTREFVAWVAANLPLDTYVNIMPQWRVEHRAFEYEDIARGITVGEFLEAMDWAREAGLTNFDERAVAAEKVYRRRLAS
ncbi:MAG: radical SAM protein [Gammaproteobacteria bacterium]|nr:radical SAM protein [Gammaproteobacteria bacterium]